MRTPLADVRAAITQPHQITPTADELQADEWLVESITPLGLSDDGQPLALISFLVPLSSLDELPPASTRAGPYAAPKTHTRVFCIAQPPLGLDSVLVRNEVTERGMTRRWIDVHMFLRYESDSSEGGSAYTQQELDAIALSHKTILMKAFRSHKGGPAVVFMDGHRWSLKPHVHISTESGYGEPMKTFPINDSSLPLADRKRMLQARKEERTQHQARVRILGSSDTLWSLYDTVTVRRGPLQKKDTYQFDLVPGKELPEMTRGLGKGGFEKILQHELVGHGLNNSDEYKQKGWWQKYFDAWGKPPEDDSIMNNLTTPDGQAGIVFYQRHWRAGILDESNIRGQKIITDSTHWLNSDDPWWSAGRMGSIERSIVRGLIE